MSVPPDPDPWAQARDRIRSLTSSHRLRHDELCTVPDNANGSNRVIGGQSLLNFCSNDYLDLAHHPRVKQAAHDATDRYGAGAMASRLVCGNLPIHQQLEEAIARLKGTEAALVFSSGYLACLGAIQSLSLRADNSAVPVFFDRLAHASLVDGATRERRNWRSFPHSNLQSLEDLLQHLPRTDWPAAIVVTEGVFSMDGDVAPLREMADLCLKYHAILVIDDAHGTGVMGDNGEGTATMAGIASQSHVVQIGTLSKALGSQGGFVAGPAILRQLLVNSARTFIFDTGLNPAAAGAALEAINVMSADPSHRQKFRDNVSLFRRLIHRQDCNGNDATPIVPVILQDEERTLKTSAELREKGFLVAAIRPPTVPAGTSRLRITISAAHHEDDIRRLAQAVAMLEVS